MNLLEVIRKGAEVPYFGGGAGSYNSFRQRLWQPGSQFAYDVEAGRVYDNGVVLPTIKWKSKAIGEANLIVNALQSDGSWAPAKRTQRIADGVTVDDVLTAFEDPNEYYDLLVMLQGIQLSWDVRGQSFLYVREGNHGRPIGFRWIFHEDCRPLADVANADGRKLITRYEYRPRGGALQYIDPARAGKNRLYPNQGWVVQIRDGIDPLQPACGLSTLAATLRDICLDNEVSTWLAGIVRNGATPGAIISPKAGVSPGDMNEAQKKNFKDLWDSFVGDKRGKALTVPLPVDITLPTWSPQQMELGKLRDIPMVRIMAALGVDPLVLGLASEKSTFANKEQAVDDAGKRTLLPSLMAWARQLTHQALPLWGVDTSRYRLGWDTSGVSWLVDDKIARDEASRKAFEAGGIDRYTFLVETGRAATDADKGVYSPKAGGQDLASDDDENEDQGAEKASKALKAYAVKCAQRRG